MSMPPVDAEKIRLGRRITDAINQLVERYGPDHPLLDVLVEQRLLELLESNAAELPPVNVTLLQTNGILP